MRKPPPEWGLLVWVLLVGLDKFVVQLAKLLVVGKVHSGFVYKLSHLLNADLEPALRGA